MSLAFELSKKLKTPQQVQRFLRQMPYNREKRGGTLRSAEQALKANTAHCFEAAFVAAAILEHHNYPSTVLSIESQDGLDHVLFLFQKNGLWGTIGRSRDEGLHGRAPVFKTLHALTNSYYDPFVDKSGKIIGYQVSHLDESQSDWRDGSRFVWPAEKYLIDLRHIPFKSSRARYKRLFENYKKKGPLLTGPHWW